MVAEEAAPSINRVPRPGNGSRCSWYVRNTARVSSHRYPDRRTCPRNEAKENHRRCTGRCNICINRDGKVRDRWLRSTKNLWNLVVLLSRYSKPVRGENENVREWEY